MLMVAVFETEESWIFDFRPPNFPIFADFQLEEVVIGLAYTSSVVSLPSLDAFTTILIDFSIVRFEYDFENHKKLHSEKYFVMLRLYHIQPT